MFEVLKIHQNSVRVEAGGGTGQGSTPYNKKPFKKDIKISKLNENRLENAPESFFKK